MERLLTAYQEDLLSLEQLRERMPLLRQREQTLRDGLNALVEQTRERAAHLRLAETLSAFLTRLRAAAETLDIVERQRIVRLIVKEVLVNDDSAAAHRRRLRSSSTGATATYFSTNGRFQFQVPLHAASMAGTRDDSKPITGTLLTVRIAVIVKSTLIVFSVRNLRIVQFQYQMLARRKQL